MERTDSSGNPMGINGEYGVNELSLLHDFMEVQDFEQFIDLINVESGVNYNGSTDHFVSDEDYLQYCVPNQPFDQEAVANTATDYVVCDPNSFLDALLEEEDGQLMKKVGEDKEEKDNGEYSSETVNVDRNGTIRTATRKRSSSTKGDRSKTLISERRRRGRMKEKLYELRALVPNITKMDKASIIGDAALYVQELQMRAKKLRAQIACLETSLNGVDEPQQPSYQPTKKIRATNSYLTAKKIAKMELVQIGEGGFYVKLVCDKGQGVAVSLYKALESFTSLDVESSNLVTVAESFVLTFTLNVGKLEVHLANLKLWVTEAFLKQGFDFKTSP